jgi:glycosyltransferase involved in cell wall biosynthesis
MKILICSEFFKPNIGGVEIHSEILAKFLSKRHKIFIATSNQNRNTKQLKLNKNINIKEFDIKGSLVKGYSGKIDNYENFLINSKFDIIFFNAAQQWTFDLALPILDKIKSKKIFFPCGFSRLNNIIFKPYFEILKTKINHFDEIICCSKNWKDYNFCKKRFKKKIHIISNGADLLKLSNKFKKNNTYVSISNLKYLKGQDRTIEIFKKLNHPGTLKLYYSNYNLTYKLYILIKIYLFNIFNSEGKKIYLKKVEGRIDLKKTLHSCKAFIFGSRLEYNPLVVFESMSAGVPFVSYDVGIIKEIVNHKHLGYVSNRQSKLIKYLDSLECTNYQRNKIINHFKKYYVWKKILQKYERIFINS